MITYQDTFNIPVHSNTVQYLLERCDNTDSAKTFDSCVCVCVE